MQAPARSSEAVPVWLQSAFRPFFLAVGLYGAVAAAGWVAVLRGAIAPPPGLPVTWWHAHEMLFGVVMAAAAGFLLTAVPVWTGTPRLSGWPLAALVALWLAGRAVWWLGAWLPPAAAWIDLAFVPVLALAIAPPILRSGTARNVGFPLVLGGLFLANLAVHGAALGMGGLRGPAALRFAVHLVLVLVVVIGGRITPAFTRNALRRAGRDAPVLDRPAAAHMAVGALVVLALADLLELPGPAAGVVALAGAAAVAARMAGWQTRRVLADPLLGSLHAAYAWVAVGLLLAGLADLGAPVAPASGLHALTAGAMGGAILAVMLRVPLGHTGRPLVAPSGSSWLLAAVHGGALLRVLVPYAPGGVVRGMLAAAGLLWGAAFLGYAIRYAPILLAPRVDGREG